MAFLLIDATYTPFINFWPKLAFSMREMILRSSVVLAVSFVMLYGT